MRNRITLISIAAFLLGACGDKHPKASDANAAEVSTVSTTPTGGSTPGPVATEAASFESANAAFKQKRYDEASRMFATYTTNQPHDVWGFYMLGLSAWKTGDRDEIGRASCRERV